MSLGHKDPMGHKTPLDALHVRGLRLGKTRVFDAVMCLLGHKDPMGHKKPMGCLTCVCVERLELMRLAPQRESKEKEREREKERE